MLKQAFSLLLLAGLYRTLMSTGINKLKFVKEGSYPLFKVFHLLDLIDLFIILIILQNHF